MQGSAPGCLYWYPRNSGWPAVCRHCGQKHYADTQDPPDPTANPEAQEFLRISQMAMQLPVPALALLPLKVVWIGRRLNMPGEAVERLLDNMDARAIVAGAQQNPSVDARKDLLVSPPLRVEFEHAIVLATIGEAAQASQGKSWGKTGITGLHPLQPNDDLSGVFIVYTLKPTAPMRQRWEWRDTIKHILGRDGTQDWGNGRRNIVNEAVRSTKRDFLADFPPAAAHLLRSRLELTPEEFWVRVRHGDRLGPGSAQLYVNWLHERTHGYEFDFSPMEEHAQPSA